MQSEESLMEREWTIETSHHCCDIDIPFLQAPWIHWLDEKFHSDLLLQSHPKGESDKQVYKQIIRILSLSSGFGSWGGEVGVVQSYWIILICINSNGKYLPCVAQIYTYENFIYQNAPQLQKTSFAWTEIYICQIINW